MNVPTRHETALFLVLYPATLVSIAALVAIVREEAIAGFIFELFSDAAWLSTVAFGALIWVIVYPRGGPSTRRERAR